MRAPENSSTQHAETVQLRKLAAKITILMQVKDSD